MIIGVGIVTTLAANGAILFEHANRPSLTPSVTRDQLVAAAHGSDLAEVAPFKKKIEPQLLVISKGGKPLPSDALEKVRKLKGVSGAELADANSAKLAGKVVSLLGVEPSSFRNYTPARTAKHDGLWRNIAAGDVAVSFVLGTDGKVALNSQVPVSGASQINKVRVGAHATMGIGDIDAVVSKATARRLGMSENNLMVVGSSDKRLPKLKKDIAKLLPAKVAVLREVSPQIDFSASGRKGSADGRTGADLSGTEIQNAVNAGLTKLNVPYVWGGESDAEGGYDCSGLLQWAFRQAGIRLPRVAQDQARTGPWLPFDQARVGDLLIWSLDPTTPGRISHIALYLGGDQMLVAPRTGDVVKIQKVYFRGFRGAVRVNRFAAAQLAG